MDIKEFKKYTNNLDAYSASEIDELKPMTDQELENYQYELDNDTGNTSTWDDARAFYTLKKRLFEVQNQLIQTLENILNTSGKSMFHNYSIEGHKKAVEIAEIALDELE